MKLNTKLAIAGFAGVVFLCPPSDECANFGFFKGSSSTTFFRLMRIRLCKSEAAAAAEAAGAAASAAAAAGVARFVVAADIVVASGIVEAPGIAVASGTAEERSLEGAWWVLRPVMALATMVAAIMAVATVIRRTKIAVEAVTIVRRLLWWRRLLRRRRLLWWRTVSWRRSGKRCRLSRRRCISRRGRISRRRCRTGRRWACGSPWRWRTSSVILSPIPPTGSASAARNRQDEGTGLARLSATFVSGAA